METPSELFHRVAHDIALASKTYGEDVSKAEKEFYQVMTSLDFLPNSPTLMNAGKRMQQLAACFVLPIEDDMGRIFETVKDAALIHQSGGGTGFSFSHLRPKNDKVLSTGGVASGPVSFMRVFDAATETIKQGGKRRGANMGILRVDHPDIMEFIHCKEDGNSFSNFNISVAITEEFMEAVQEDIEYNLVNPRNKEVTKKIHAKDVFDAIVKMAWTNGSCGIVFLDRMNKDNPTPYLGKIESTNPCGEQPLLPYEACNLGSINLAHMIKTDENKSTIIDWERIQRTVEIGVRFLDNAIDRCKYPLPKISEMAKGNRKIGFGVMGFADLLIQLKIPYDSEEGVNIARSVISFIHENARKKSMDLANARGEFPNFSRSIYDIAGEDRKPLRNATVTTIAPTGTLSILAGCSSGIEPLFALSFVRNVLDNDKLRDDNPYFVQYTKQRGIYSEKLMELILERGSCKGIVEIPQKAQNIFVTSHDIAPEWHVKMQGSFQEFVDNAVSKTVNLPNQATVEDVAQVYKLAYQLGCKGVTVYRDGSRTVQVLQKTEEALRDKLTPRKRPSRTVGVTEKVITGCGTLYITINEDINGICEVFCVGGKSGGCVASQNEALGRIVSLALRSGIKSEQIIKQLKGIRCPSPKLGERGSILSCSDAIAKTVERYLDPDDRPGKSSRLENFLEMESSSSNNHYENFQQKNISGMSPECPSCGNLVYHAEGCILCPVCGYSKCW